LFCSNAAVKHESKKLKIDRFFSLKFSFSLKIMGFWRKFQKDYGKEKVFFRSTKWIMERVKGFVCFCVGFKGFIKDYGKRKGKRKKLWKRMPTLADGWWTV